MKSHTEYMTLNIAKHMLVQSTFASIVDLQVFRYHTLQIFLEELYN